ncbi:FliO/MopB family protein [Baekduia soli]|uniref:FliO/MopB family protein n=1 Tax=Baekduia soli TaxID=496014 RepID=A0A5B8U1P1_9ACTN|nr:flagellar biosynthetic protein FliO [Baekduia soli]QEC46860.1 FliO/MopB family protein [Baekduia soli]
MKPHRLLTAACAAALLCVLLAPATVLAATSKDPYGEKTPLNLPADSGGAAHASVGGGTGGSLARTFIGLAVVVAVIYGLTWVLRQLKASKAERSHGVGLSTEASMPLGPGRSVHLIRAGRELVLVGSAEHGIMPIRTYTEDEARSLGLLAPTQLEAGDVIDATTGGPAALARARIGDVLDRLRDRTAR